MDLLSITVGNVRSLHASKRDELAVMRSQSAVQCFVLHGEMAPQQHNMACQWAYYLLTCAGVA